MIYLDNNATTPMTEQVKEAIRPFLEEEFGNPSTVYQLGNRAKVAVERARNQVARALGVTASEITFTGSGSEADNMALVGGMLASQKRKTMVISGIEHAAVDRSAHWLQRFGFRLKVAPVVIDADGMNPQPIIDCLDEDTAMVSVMMANNETGLILPAAEVFAAAKAKGILCHTDAVQAFGKIPVAPKALGADLACIAAHKVHGPKGVGVLYTRRGVQIEPLIHGGSQENKRRAGTENVINIVGMGAACAAVDLGLMDQVRQMRNRFEQSLIDQFGDRVSIHFRHMPRTPNTSSVCFKGQDANLLLIKLDRKGICVSTGSACHSGSLTVSGVLRALGISETDAQGTIRFSLSKLTTAREIDTTLETLKDILSRN